MCAMHSNVMTSLPSVPFLKEFRKLNSFISKHQGKTLSH